MPAGQPTKYDPKYCKMIVEEFRKGGHMRTFADLIDVEKKTLYNWMKVHPEFLHAQRKAQNAAATFWNKLALGLITGKLKGGNATTYIYNMKNRFPEWTSDGPVSEEESISDRWEDPESLT